MTSTDPRQAGRVALVTGAARRIGRAIARALSDAGYAVAIHADRSVADAQALCAEIVEGGGRAAVVQADLADPAAVKRVIASASAALGPLTLLVNNASVFERDEVGALDVARWDRHFAVNLRAPVFLAEAFATQVPDGEDASIINILDQRVLKLTPQFTSYTLSKSALHTATRTLAQALAPKVRVNAIAPGPTVASPRQQPDDFIRQAAAVPLGHGPSAAEIAEAVVFLSRARSISGQTLAVDGGQHFAWQTPDVDGINE